MCSADPQSQRQTVTRTHRAGLCLLVLIQVRVFFPEETVGDQSSDPSEGLGLPERFLAGDKRKQAEAQSPLLGRCRSQALGRA